MYVCVCVYKHGRGQGSFSFIIVSSSAVFFLKIIGAVHDYYFSELP